MKILIIDGCPRKGNTWKLTLLDMEKIRHLCLDTEFEEITLSKLNLPFCTGCSNCFRLGPEKCPHYSIVGEVVHKIEQADGIIICSTCVGCRETTLLKNLFDHWCYMMHRPYFYKSKALIITSAGGKGQAKTINRAFFTVRNILSFWSTILCEAWDNTMRKALGIRLLMEPGGQIRAEITAFTSLK